MSDQRTQDVDDLMVIAHEAGLPERIMSFLIKNDIVACINDLRLITPDDIKDLHQIYMESTEPEADDKRLWTFLVSSHLRFLIEWINSYHRAYARAPEVIEITKENLVCLPEESIGTIEIPERRESYGFSPFKKPSNVTNRKSYASMMTQGSQVVNKRNVKVSITEYPKFSGQAKDWVTFERKFRSVASSQGFDYILKEEEYYPTDEFQKKQ